VLQETVRSVETLERMRSRRQHVRDGDKSPGAQEGAESPDRPLSRPRGMTLAYTSPGRLQTTKSRSQLRSPLRTGGSRSGSKSSGRMRGRGKTVSPHGRKRAGTLSMVGMRGGLQSLEDEAMSHQISRRSLAFGWQSLEQEFQAHYVRIVHDEQVNIYAV